MPQKSRKVGAHLVDDINEGLSDFPAQVVRQTRFIIPLNDILDPRDDRSIREG